MYEEILPSADGVISAQLLSQIEALHVIAKGAARGALAGIHPSSRRGTAIEFSEHKVYSPGDDIRHIDWHAFGKSDRFHIKQFEDETNLQVELLIDHSGSMGFAGINTSVLSLSTSTNTGADEGIKPREQETETHHAKSRLSKLDYGKQLVAALGYIALRQGDAMGMLSFADKITGELSARSSSAHLAELLLRLVQLSPSNETNISQALEHFANTRRSRTVTFLLSDLFDVGPRFEEALRRLRARRHDVTVIHLLDPDELNFPYDSPAQFDSLEGTQSLFIHPRAVRSRYMVEIQKFLERTEQIMLERGIAYHKVLTHTDPGDAMRRILQRGR